MNLRNHFYRNVRMTLLAFFLLIGISRCPPPSEAGTPGASGKSAQGQVVLVGKNGLKFQPARITAAINEKITFVFFAKNHTLTQTSRETPCSAISKSFDSGFISVPANSAEFPNEILTVKTTKPIYFACVQKKHCEMGMVGGINLPDQGPGGLEAFAVKAKALFSAPKKEEKKAT